MYEEDVVFGPLTIKQFIIVALGIVIGYGAHSLLAAHQALGVIIFLVLLVGYIAFVRFAPKRIPVQDIEKYFEMKKYELGAEKYFRLLKSKQANIAAQIHMRKARGFTPDPKLDELSLTFTKLIEKAKNENLK